MNKKEILSNLIIASGLGLIFGSALYKWELGLMIGAIYFLTLLLIIKIKNK